MRATRPCLGGSTGRRSSSAIRGPGCDRQDRRPLLLLLADQAGRRAPARLAAADRPRARRTRTSSRSTTSPRRSTTSLTSPGSTAAPSTSPTPRRQRAADVINTFAKAADAPQFAAAAQRRSVQRRADGRGLAALASCTGAHRATAGARRVRRPGARSLEYVDIPTEFDCCRRDGGAGGVGDRGAAASRATPNVLWEYWRAAPRPGAVPQLELSRARSRARTLLITGGRAGSAMRPR